MCSCLKTIKKMKFWARWLIDKWKQRRHLPLLKKNRKYKNIHKGEYCFIIGNGPSLEQINFSDLTQEIVFTVNQLPRVPEFSKLKTNYHLWADQLFFDLQPNRSEDMELLEVMKSVQSAENHPGVFYKTEAAEIIRKYNLDKEAEVSYFMDVASNLASPSKRFSLDDALPRFPTVVHYAILIAVYMGFDEIYLLGCDCTAIINTLQAKMKTSENFQYAYEISSRERERMWRVSNERALASELRSNAALFEQYEMLYKYCERQGVKLFNATNGGLLESIPRVDLKKVLKEKNIQSQQRNNKTEDGSPLLQ